jgi:predicted ester cyclase
MMSAEHNKTIYRRYVEECWSDGDMDLQDHLVARDVVDHNPFPGVPVGHEGRRVTLRLFRSAFDLKTKLDLLLTDGDYVIGRWTAQFVHKGDFLGIPATGKQATVTGIDICRCRDGKIVEMWHQEGIMSLMQQLGVVPAPGPSASA